MSNYDDEDRDDYIELLKFLAAVGFLLGVALGASVSFAVLGWGL